MFDDKIERSKGKKSGEHSHHAKKKKNRDYLFEKERFMCLSAICFQLKWHKFLLSGVPCAKSFCVQLWLCQILTTAQAWCSILKKFSRWVAQIVDFCKYHSKDKYRFGAVFTVNHHNQKVLHLMRCSQREKFCLR